MFDLCLYPAVYIFALLIDGHDQRPCGKAYLARLEGLIDCLDFEVFQMKSQRYHVVGAVVRDGISSRGLAAAYFPDNLRLRDRRNRRIENGFVGALFYYRVSHQSHSPSCVVISAE